MFGVILGQQGFFPGTSFLQLSPDFDLLNGAEHIPSPDDVPDPNAKRRQAASSRSLKVDDLAWPDQDSPPRHRGGEMPVDTPQHGDTYQGCTS